MAKKKVLLSLDEDTADRLRAYARQKHSNVSQIITDWIWIQPVEPEPAEDDLPILII